MSTPRIHGELLKLGTGITQATAAKYMGRHRGPQNGHAERLIGSVRRECLDHVVVFGEGHLRRVVRRYAGYYNTVRTHHSLVKDATDR